VSHVAQQRLHRTPRSPGLHIICAQLSHNTQVTTGIAHTQLGAKGLVTRAVHRKQRHIAVFAVARVGRGCATLLGTLACRWFRI
jgi:hypothetical protein